MTAAVPMPASCALSRMNASLELPTANTSEPARSQRNAGDDGSESLKARAWGGSRCSFTRKTMATTLSSPGMTAMAKIHRSGTSACTSASATSGPSTAPSVSMARCKPNARPCCPGRVVAAMRSSRGAVRMPLPRRSVNRPASAVPQPGATAMISLLTAPRV